MSQSDSVTNSILPPDRIMNGTLPHITCFGTLPLLAEHHHSVVEQHRNSGKSPQQNCGIWVKK